MPHISDRLARANFIISGHTEQSPPATATLFAYGTLTLDPVIQVLLDRVPQYSKVTLSGWATVSIPGVIYPGLVRGAGQISVGRAYAGLTIAEWALIDEFENPEYRLEPVHPDSATTTTLAYVWRHHKTSQAAIADREGG